MISADLATHGRGMPDYRILRRSVPDSIAERKHLLAGLLAETAMIPPKYFYDPLGCALFAAICEVPEYYPTRAEHAIFEMHAAEIATIASAARQLVDLGAGDGSKGSWWLQWLKPDRYVAVDIAPTAIEAALSRMAREHPNVQMEGIVADFTAGLDLGSDLTAAPSLFFYAGSSIGNFVPDEALAFLQSVHAHCVAPGRTGSGLLIGVDAKKSSHRLEAAYDDGLGVTSAFNRNVLLHVNRILGCDFAIEAWVHRAHFNAAASRIEMHLEATADQIVRFPGVERRFASGERIHTESSYKYAPEEFSILLQRSGFARVRYWQDAAHDFSVFYAQ